MNEAKILGTLLKSREAWDKVKPHLTDKDFSGDGLVIYRQINEFYETDKSAATVDTDIVRSRIGRSVSSNKIVTQLESILDQLEKISAPNIEREIIALRRFNTGLRLSSFLAAGRQGREVDELVQEFTSLGTTQSLDVPDEDVEVQDSRVDNLLKESFDEKKLIKLVPESLNKAVDGGCRPGHHILIFAPTEMGKTLVAINLVAGFTAQGLRTLYIGNEDPTSDIMMRYINRISGMNKFEVKREPGKAQKLCDARRYGLLTLVGLAPGTFKQISALVEKHKPQVLVLDQLRNLDVDSENRTQALEKAATEARNIGKRSDLLVISVAQAADSASGKRILDRGDVDGSNVGIPGQIDLMIGVGADDDMEKMNMRMFSFPKNKLSGKHEPITVSIDPQLSKVIDQTESYKEQA